MKTTKMLLAGAVVVTGLLALSNGNAMYAAEDLPVNGSGDQIRTMLHTGENLDNTGAMLRQARKTQLKQQLGDKADVVDAIMNKWQKRYANEDSATKLNEFTQLQERVSRIQGVVENMDITQERKELYRNTFEYLSLQLEDSIAELSD